MEISKDKLTKLRTYLLEAKCTFHPDYQLEYFCQVKDCRNGLLCRACMAEHDLLRHQDLTVAENGSLIEITHFLDTLFNEGIYYGLGEDLKTIYVDQNVKRIREAKVKMRQRLEHDLKMLKTSFEECQEKVLQIVAAKLSVVKSKLISQLESSFAINLTFLEDLLKYNNDIKRKRDSSFKFVWSEIDSCNQADYFDIEKVTMAIQSYLCSTFTNTERQSIDLIKKASSFLENRKIDPLLDLELLKQNIKDAEIDIVDTINNITKGIISEPEINLPAHLTSIRKLGSTVSLQIEIAEKTRVSVDDDITALGLIDSKHYIVGFSSGIIKIFRSDTLSGSNNQIPIPQYQTGTIFHSSSIVGLHSFNRISDHKKIVISTDAKGNIIFSEFREDLAIKLDQIKRIEKAHFFEIKQISSISKSNFAMSFSKREPIKLWNTKLGFLSKECDSLSPEFNLSVCYVNGYQGIIIGKETGEVELRWLVYTNYTTNIDIDKKSIINKIFEFRPKGLELASLNNTEIPYFAVLAHDYKRIFLKVLASKSLEILHSINNPFTDISGGLSISECFLSFNLTKEKINKFDSIQFMNITRVFAYNPILRSLILVGPSNGDLELKGIIEMIGYPSRLIIEDFGKDGQFISVDTSLECLVPCNYK